MCCLSFFCYQIQIQFLSPETTSTNNANFLCSSGSECSINCASDSSCSDFNFYCETGATCSIGCDNDEDVVAIDADVNGNGNKIQMISSFSSLDTNWDLLKHTDNNNNTNMFTFNNYNPFIILTILAFAFYGLIQTFKHIYYYCSNYYKNKNEYKYQSIV